MTRTQAAENAADKTARSQSVRVMPLHVDGGGAGSWLVFGSLARRYVERLQGRHPWPPRAEQLIAEAARPEVCTYLAYRHGRAVGFAMAEPREAGTGEPVMWIDHFYSPGDLGAARALVAEVERLAEARGHSWMAFETAMPDMKGRVALAGFKPVATIYGREVQQHGQSFR